MATSKKRRPKRSKLARIATGWSVTARRLQATDPRRAESYRRAAASVERLAGSVTHPVTSKARIAGLKGAATRADRAGQGAKAIDLRRQARVAKEHNARGKAVRSARATVYWLRRSLRRGEVDRIKEFTTRVSVATRSERGEPSASRSFIVQRTLRGGHSLAPWLESIEGDITGINSWIVLGDRPRRARSEVPEFSRLELLGTEYMAQFSDDELEERFDQLLDLWLDLEDNGADVEADIEYPEA